MRKLPRGVIGNTSGFGPDILGSSPSGVTEATVQGTRHSLVASSELFSVRFSGETCGPSVFTVIGRLATLGCCAIRCRPVCRFPILMIVRLNARSTSLLRAQSGWERPRSGGLLGLVRHGLAVMEAPIIHMMHEPRG